MNLLAIEALTVVVQLVAPAHGRVRPRRALAVHLRNGFYANAVFDRLTGALRRPASNRTELA